MKKIFTSLLIAITIIFAGCGNNVTNSNNENVPATPP